MPRWSYVAVSRVFWGRWPMEAERRSTYVQTVVGVGEVEESSWYEYVEGRVDDEVDQRKASEDLLSDAVHQILLEELGHPGSH